MIFPGKSRKQCMQSILIYDRKGSISFKSTLLFNTSNHRGLKNGVKLNLDYMHSSGRVFSHY